MNGEYQTLLRILNGRRSVRRFLRDPVPAKLLQQILEAAGWAPSAGNRQNYRLVVVSSPDKISAMSAAVEEAVAALRAGLRGDSREVAGAYLNNFSHFSLAPIVIVPIHRSGVDLLQACQDGDPSRQQPMGRAELEAVSSVAAAIMNLLLAAHALGLGACWMTGPLVALEALNRILDVPKGWTVSALIPVGYPGETPPPPPRRALEHLIRRID